MKFSLKNEHFIRVLQSVILLFPVFCILTESLVSPLFYFLLTVLICWGFNQKVPKPKLLFQNYILVLGAILLIFCVFQITPLPLVLLKYISSTTYRIVLLMKETAPGFYSVAVLPFSTLIFLLKFITIIMFSRLIMGLNFNRKEMISLLNTIILSALIISGLIFTPLAGGITVKRYFTFYLVMVFPLVPALLLYKLGFFENNKSIVSKLWTVLARDKVPLLYISTIATIPLALLYTTSRPALITCGVSCFILVQATFYYKHNRSVRKKLKNGLIIITALVIILGVKSGTKSLMSPGENGPEFDNWRMTLKIFKDFPLAGCGYGSWNYVNKLYNRDVTGVSTQVTNNGYLEMVSGGGIFGSFLFFLWIGVIYLSVIKMWRKRRHPQIRIIGLGLIIALFSAFFYYFFNGALFHPPILIVFTILLSMVIKFVTYKKKTK